MVGRQPTGLGRLLEQRGGAIDSDVPSDTLELGQIPPNSAITTSQIQDRAESAPSVERSQNPGVERMSGRGEVSAELLVEPCVQRQ